jgi:hypothetical protein
MLSGEVRMGYRGKLVEQQRARELRAESWTLQAIADELGVAKSSVSTWVREVPFTPGPRSTARRRGPNALQRRKQLEIDELLEEGRRRIGDLSERDLLVAGTAVYAGEGFKRDGDLGIANTDPRILFLFCEWLRRFFPVENSRFRVRIYLHAGLDLEAATTFWSEVTKIPTTQFTEPYRATADPSIRRAKHPHGCPRVTYRSARTHRAVMGLVEALLGPGPLGHQSPSVDLNGCDR